ncbi:helix-turn-helix domain-containing protein, partial [Mycobacteroides chelonae]|uniref:helix-turn-helix domain-containing protein n=1 Tax=Mycobacteroides chelonae TaxID=1774 RepID=UPI00104273EA
MTSGHEIISARRKEIDWSQAKLSKALGIGLTTFQRYERGERPIPLPVARKIAEILDVSLAEIAGQLQAAEPTATPLSVAGDAILARRKQLGLTAARAAATV